MNIPDRLANVKCFLLDMDGTFYLDNLLLEGALRFIDVLRVQKKDFLFLTNNSSKSRHQYAEKITALGLPTTRSGSRPVEALTKAIMAPISGIYPLPVGQLKSG